MILRIEKQFAAYKVYQGKAHAPLATFAYAADAKMFAEAKLSAAYDAFLAEHKLPPMSADELFAEVHDQLGEAPRQWLLDFITSWEESVDRSFA